MQRFIPFRLLVRHGTWEISVHLPPPCWKAEEDFWVKPDNGLHFIWKETVTLYPIDLIAVVNLAKAAVRTGTRKVPRVSFACLSLNQIKNKW